MKKMFIILLATLFFRQASAQERQEPSIFNTTFTESISIVMGFGLMTSLSQDTVEKKKIALIRTFFIEKKVEKRKKLYEQIMLISTDKDLIADPSDFDPAKTTFYVSGGLIIVDSYTAAGEWEKAKQFIAKLKHPCSKETATAILASGLNNIGDYNAAQELLQPIADKLSGLDSSTARDVLFIHGETLLGLQQYEKALTALAPFQKEAPFYFSNKSGKELYALCRMGMKDKAVRGTIDSLLATGNASKRFLAAVESFYTQTDGNNQEYSALQQKIQALMKTKLEKEELNTIAPDFKLTDLKGKQVSLHDFSGKVVVLDFWATWCIPCKLAFPMMRDLMKEYAKDPSVVFLFVHTQEAGEPKQVIEEVKAYLKDTKYPFRVLMDLKEQSTKKSPVAGKYNINSIPAKFIIDPKGNIRFREVGGNRDRAALNELKAKIEMAKLAPSKLSKKQ